MDRGKVKGPAAREEELGRDTTIAGEGEGLQEMR